MIAITTTMLTFKVSRVPMQLFIIFLSFSVIVEKE